MASTQREYPVGVPDKFDRDGNVQNFPGNTILCPLRLDIPSNKALNDSLVLLYDKIKQSSLSKLFALLPPSSYHMTVFEGVTDKCREPGWWPSDLALDEPLKRCTEHFEKKLRAFDLYTSLPYRISITGFTTLDAGIGLHLEPHAEDNLRLRHLRDRLADLLELRRPGHATYGLHVSIAYSLAWPNSEQKAEMTKLLMDHFQTMPHEFELETHEFCTFEDMFAFHPILELKYKPL